MTDAEMQRLPHGVYRIHWLIGGSSVAAVGCNREGYTWIAPANWVNGPWVTTPSLAAQILSMELIAEQYE